jgi:hypothetical protein
MIEHPLALGPILVGIALGIIFRGLWLLARQK